MRKPGGQEIDMEEGDNNKEKGRFNNSLPVAAGNPNYIWNLPKRKHISYTINPPLGATEFRI